MTQESLYQQEDVNKSAAVVDLSEDGFASQIAAMFGTRISHVDSLPYDPDAVLRASTSDLASPIGGRTTADLAQYLRNEHNIPVPLEAVVIAEHYTAHDDTTMDIVTLCHLLDAHSIWIAEQASLRRRSQNIVSTHTRRVLAATKTNFVATANRVGLALEHATDSLLAAASRSRRGIQGAVKAIRR